MFVVRDVRGVAFSSVWLILFLLAVTLSFASDSWPVKSLIRIQNPTSEMLIQIHQKGLIPASEAEIRKWIDVWADQEQIYWLQQTGWQTELIPLPQGIATAFPALDPEFHDYNKMVAVLDSLVIDHPGLCKKESLGVSTQLGRIMWGFKISDNADTDEDEPVVLYDGTHHACEVMGLELNMRLIKELLDEYGINPQVTNWVNSTEIWFVPLVNVDGHDAVVNDISLFWRKNARDLDLDGNLYEYLCNDWWTCSTEGIDLNRNYDWYWNQGGSPDPWNYYYRGVTPFSEGETRANRDLALKVRPSLYITFHSYGEVVIYPWYGAVAPDQPLLNQVAYQISSRILTPTSPFGYSYYTDYYTQGESYLWMYGALGTLGFLIETLPYPSFIPPGTALDSIYSEIKPGMTYLLERVQGPGVTGIVTDSITGQPLVGQVEILNFDLSAVLPRTSDSTFGRYRWLLQPGSYSLKVTHPLYYPKTVQFSVSGTNYTQVNVALKPRPSEPSLVTEPGSVSDTLFADTSATYYLNIINEGLDTLTFNVAYSPVNWLNLPVTNGAVLSVDTFPVPVQVNTDSMSPGNYFDTLLITSNDPSNPSRSIPVQLEVVCLLKPMDANSSGNLTLADVIHLVNYIFNKPGFSVTYICQGDLDSPALPANSKINLSDVIGLVNWYLKGNASFTPRPNHACCQVVN
jgi:hypothetical protein